MTRREAFGLALAAACAGCASAELAYYTLAPVPGPVSSGGPRLVELRRPGLAGYLDRPEIVRASGTYSLRLAGTERWGEPFGDLVARILAENLNLRLPGSSVFTSSGSISAEANATVELDIQRFDADAAGQVMLLAQVAVSRGRARASAATRTVRLSV
ncbi:MAG: membrane integrity-associated transporter subunit PqiC, partial [Gemmatimonadaceae bacterium]|nr:membrane integrity-associated transporter subunit PqiC [Acetobacteraceae bacterium]